MRYTYANESAWKTLSHDSVDYQDDAVFAKVGIATMEDPDFPSSSVPSGARRYQFMIRNKTQFKETNGWGYALFDAEGKTFPGDPHLATLDCAACHQIVENRGYVFSQISELSAFQKEKNKKVQNFVSDSFAKIRFESVEASELEPQIIKYLPALLISEKKDMFSLAMLNEESQSCKNANEVSMLGVQRN